jgi:hypothetical protein
MKKFLIATILMGFVLFGNSQSAKQIFESPDLKSMLYTAKTVAILPFKVSISYKRMPKNVTLDQIKNNEKAESGQMQEGMYTYLLRKSKDYSVSFQEVERTNALLKKAGVFESIDEVLADSLCKILGVDAVIKSSWSYQKTGSEGAAIATHFYLV